MQQRAQAARSWGKLGATSVTSSEWWTREGLLRLCVRASLGAGVCHPACGVAVRPWCGHEGRGAVWSGRVRGAGALDGGPCGAARR